MTETVNVLDEFREKAILDGLQDEFGNEKLGITSEILDLFRFSDANDVKLLGNVYKTEVVESLEGEGGPELQEGIVKFTNKNDESDVFYISVRATWISWDGFEDNFMVEVVYPKEVTVTQYFDRDHL